MGYSNIKADRQHDADQRRIRELEAQLRRERNQPKQAQPPQSTNGVGHVTIEKTSKALKSQMLASWFVLILGIILIPAGSGLGPLMLVVGIVAVIVTKVQIWWRHG